MDLTRGGIRMGDALNMELDDLEGWLEAAIEYRKAINKAKRDG